MDTETDTSLVHVLEGHGNPLETKKYYTWSNAVQFKLGLILAAVNRRRQGSGTWP